jgi:hypothetical protein
MPRLEMVSANAKSENTCTLALHPTFVSLHAVLLLPTAVKCHSVT